MAAELQLHVSKADFTQKVDELDTLLQKLNDVKTRYQNQKNKVSTFMEETDDNFEAMCQNCQENIDAVDRGIKFTQAARDNLQKTIDQMDESMTNIGNVIKEGTEAAKNIITTAIRVETLGI